MGKKSAAQLRRLEKRAAERGEAYVAPVPKPDASIAAKSRVIENLSNQDMDSLKNAGLRLKIKLDEIESNPDFGAKDRRSAKRRAEAIATEETGKSASYLLQLAKEKENITQSNAEPENNQRIEIAERLSKELESIDNNTELKSKDRRSAKRKAEAIALEKTGIAADELLSWYEGIKKNGTSSNTQRGKAERRQDPLIAFVGQLSYDTSSEELMEHICSHLSADYQPRKIKETTKIRLLTDPRSKKSRGMAFVEVDDPEFLYALLKLHQTYLKGRRINVERSAGGKKHSEARKSKLENYRKEQGAYFAEVVENILSEYRKTGELQANELDEGVITVCKRHAGPVVQAAVTEYIEKGGRNMDNPSAYLTFLVTKFAKEGIHDVEDTGKSKKMQDIQGKRKRLRISHKNDNLQNTRPRTGSFDYMRKGIDMSISEKLDVAKEPDGRTTSLAKIFPSSQRGRGRGYMRNVR